ncbi:MAG: tetratricopeptide repeat protein [Magnetococcus sp. MYC-9]
MSRNREAIALFAEGKISEALSVTREILANATAAPDVAMLNLSAACYMQLERPERAISCWQEALNIQPYAVDIHNNLGILLQRQNRVEEAEEAFRKALDIQPNRATTLYNFGHFLQEQNRLEEAEGAYRQAISLQPDFAGAHNNLGNLLKRQNRLEDAFAAYRQAICLQPDNAKALYNLGGLLHEYNRLEEAEAVYRQALALDPTLIEGEHMLSAIRGEHPPQAPEQYVRNLFNAYADHFEESLVQKLHYDMPRILHQMLEQTIGKGVQVSRCVDLGCGTGLLGQLFRTLCTHLVGIDLSDKMIAQAAKKAMYDQLYLGDIVATLQQIPVGVDLFLAADVLVYIGALRPLFQTIQDKSSPGALFVFSVEHLESGEYLLRPSGRYAHARAYIERLAQEHHFSMLRFETHPLRLEQNQMITGGVYLLQRS